MARLSARPQSGHTILVVDDQPEAIISVQGLLEREGHRVLGAESGSAALVALRDTEIHVIVLDYMMPRMDGAQLVREIRRFDPYVQIILQTGYAGDQVPRRVLGELDIQGYHDKADDPERLLLWVDVALKTHRLLTLVRDRERVHSELVANCSHEFRTPLNILAGYVELMREGAFGSMPGGTATPLHAMQDAIRTLTDMVQDFLSYARLEAGVVRGEPMPVDLTQLAAEMSCLAGSLLEHKPVIFNVELDPTLPCLHIDGAKVRTVLRNLVTNAAKFTARGTVALRVLRRQGGVRIEVQDTGPGIAPEHHELIFEPFRQLDGSSTRSHGGVGLGLALSRKLARTLGGDIELWSEPGRGCRFTLVLPQAALGLEAPGERSETASPAA